jgi:hypothetical protein
VRERHLDRPPFSVTLTSHSYPFHHTGRSLTQRPSRHLTGAQVRTRQFFARARVRQSAYTMTSTSNTPFATPATSNPNSRPTTPSPATPPSGASVPADNELRDESSKLRTFLGLLKKYVTLRGRGWFAIKGHGTACEGAGTFLLTALVLGQIYWRLRYRQCAVLIAFAVDGTHTEPG